MRTAYRVGEVTDGNNRPVHDRTPINPKRADVDPAPVSGSSGLIPMELRFVNANHEHMYHEARAMLDGEFERQILEWERMEEQWRGYPEPVLAERRAWLQHHFAECRRPYEKILTEIVSLCPVAYIMPKPDDADGPTICAIY